MNRTFYTTLPQNSVPGKPATCVLPFIYMFCGAKSRGSHLLSTCSSVDVFTILKGPGPSTLWLEHIRGHPMVLVAGAAVIY